MGFGALAGSIVAGYAFVLGEVLAGAGLTVAGPLGILVFAGVSALMMEGTDLARHVGAWSYEDGKIRAAQAVLDILNKKEFQAQAKELVKAEFAKRLRTCMDELADLRDPNTSTSPEAEEARGIQAKVADLQGALSRWFKRFVERQVGRDPWLVAPPEDLRVALLEPSTNDEASAMSEADDSSSCEED